MHRFIYLVILVLGGIVLNSDGFLAETAHAHGTEVAYNVSSAVTIEARYDNGEPMADAQVTIYAPDNPQSPWQIGQADSKGLYTFVPDTAIPGRWDLSIRTAGHGEMVYVDVDETNSIAEISGGSSGFTMAQIALMSVSVIWGCVGTALYFMGGNQGKQKGSLDTPSEVATTLA
ncbi:MAG: carboxypeptidase regulatory-like domain-containing protein [Chloroflexota bacterium]